MELYAAMYLHSRSNCLGIIDEEDKRIFKKNLSKIRQIILEILKPYQRDPG